MGQVFPFVGPSYLSQSPTVDCEQTMNLYTEAVEAAGAKTKYALYPCPGFVLFTTIPQSPIRAMFAQDGRSFVVGGSGLYEIADSGVATLLGTMAIDQYPATICSNGQGGHQLCVSSGNHAYIYDLLSGVFSHVLTGARMVQFLDGYFLALDADTSTLKLSSLEDGTTWDPTDIAQRSTAGDKWAAMIVSNRNVWLLGSASGEVWYNSGAALFPLEPISGAFFEVGIAAPFSLAVLDDAPTWLSANERGTAMLMRASGYTPRPISPEPVAFAMQGYSTIADAVAFTYQDQSHFFYVLNFPTAAATWAYDTKTKLFHQRGFWDVVNTIYQAYRPQYHTFTFKKHLVGDRLSGGIYQMSIATATEVDGSGIRRLRQVPVYAPTDGWIRHRAFQLDLEPGLGLSTGQGSDPQVMLQMSNNGGKTFGNEHWESAGALGTYGTRVSWTRLGRARGYNRVYRVVMTDPVPWRIATSYLDAS